jgi:hypothetical protein
VPDISAVQRLLVTVSRDWPAPTLLVKTLKDCYRQGMVLVVGDIRGTDPTVARYWRKQGGEVDVFGAEWARWGHRAWALRNEVMCRSLMPDRDLCLAFICNGDPISTHCLAYAQEWGIQSLDWRLTIPALVPDSALLHKHA